MFRTRPGSIPATAMDNNFYFHGHCKEGNPYGGYIRCLLGEGLKNPRSGQIFALVLYLGEICDGHVHGRGRLHILHLDENLQDLVFIGNIKRGRLDWTSVVLTDIQDYQKQVITDYIRANAGHLNLPRNLSHALLARIQQNLQKDNARIRKDCLWNFAHTVVSNLPVTSEKRSRASDDVTTAATTSSNHNCVQRPKRMKNNSQNS